MGLEMGERDIGYLRQKAEQFRRLANEGKTAVSATLLQIAAELETKAAEIEAQLKPPR